ncbi:hypothetical protein [Nonomuraea sp. NPDC048916]|uniref:hypothetical protein n=1 Tax=Nonomuraea sp. NPDC048916 TaxID=3154232 RepID=UPI0033F95D63
MLDPRVYLELSPSELSHALVEQISHAARAVAEQSRELIGPLLPDDLPSGWSFGDHPGPDDLLPRSDARRRSLESDVR